MKYKRKHIEIISPLGKTCSVANFDKLSDKNIDIKLSPFASYKGDNHHINKPKRATLKSEVDFLLEKGHIGDIEKKILYAINNLVFATSLQITTYLNKSGISIESKSVARKLTRLKEKSFVKQIEFVSEGSISSYKAYYLGYHGIGLLKALDKKVYLPNYISQMQTFKIKSILASNQLLTQVMEDSTDFKVSKVVLNKNVENCIVKPQAVLSCDNRKYLVQFVRKIEGWEEKLLNKLQRYDNIVKSYKSLNMEFEDEPILIIQSESYEQMLDVMKVIKNRKKESNIEIIYTYDRALLYDLENAFYIQECKHARFNLFSRLFKS